jgi:hypothetical protein
VKEGACDLFVSSSKCSNVQFENVFIRYDNHQFELKVRTSSITGDAVRLNQKPSVNYCFGVETTILVHFYR